MAHLDPGLRRDDGGFEPQVSAIGLSGALLLRESCTEAV